MFCPHCKAPNEPDALFCSHCGKELTPHPKKNLWKLIAALAILAVLAVPYFYFSPLSPPLPKQEQPSSEETKITPELPLEASSTTKAMMNSLDAYLKALKEKNLQSAYHETSSGFQENTSFEKFDKFIGGFPLLTQFDTDEIQEHSIDNGRGSALVILNSGKQALTVDFRLVQENGTWKILFMRVLQPTQNVSIGGKLDTLSMIATVREQLEALRKNAVEQAYYKFMSKSLQKETSLENFKNFVKHYPALVNYKSINLKEPSLEDKVGEVFVELRNTEEQTEIQYALEEQEGEWKIVGMHAESIPLVPNEQDSQDKNGFKTHDLIDAIQNFLTAIRTNALSKAYKEFTAEHFRKENSLAEFQDFIKTHPEIVKTHSASFEKLMFNNNIATFAVVLFITDTQVVPVEFDLLQEKGQWKILHIIAYPQREIDPTKKKITPESNVPKIEFTKAIIGTKINDEGVIQDPATTLKKPGDIYVNLNIHNGIAGTHFEVILRHVDSGSEIPAVHASVVEDGNSIVTLVFSPPPRGWPLGNYQIKAASDNEIFKTFVFKVE